MIQHIPADVAPIVDELLPVLRQFCRSEYGIALGGAHAKGVDDKESDIDLYLFARQVLSGEERTRLCERLPGGGSVVSWGDTREFVQAGTDFRFGPHRIECWLRNTEYISNIIADSKAGVVRHDFVTWTVMGFYNHCALSDLTKMIPVDDPYEILARLKSEVSVYPPKLREAIVAGHMKAAKFWPENPHYRSAVERCDVIYVAGIVQQVVNNLIQVVFALNEVYFPGEKKLGVALDRLAKKPVSFTERIKRLVSPGTEPDLVFLREQRGELAQLVDEVESLLTQALMVR